MQNRFRLIHDLPPETSSCDVASCSEWTSEGSDERDPDILQRADLLFEMYNCTYFIIVGLLVPIVNDHSDLPPRTNKYNIARLLSFSLLHSTLYF
jgi:hypothetical protein